RLSWQPETPWPPGARNSWADASTQHGRRQRRKSSDPAKRRSTRYRKSGCRNSLPGTSLGCARKVDPSPMEQLAAPRTSRLAAETRLAQHSRDEVPPMKPPASPHVVLPPPSRWHLSTPMDRHSCREDCEAS